MTEIERLQDQLRQSWDGDAWHGPSLRDLLAGVDAPTAAMRPIEGAHTIWELVLHVTGWQNRARRRLSGDPARATPEEDWPPVAEADEAGSDAAAKAWYDAVAALDASRARLLAAVAGLDPRRLDAPSAPGGRDTPYVLVHGVIQHDLYHGGQIALLRKAARPVG